MESRTGRVKDRLVWVRLQISSVCVDSLKCGVSCAEVVGREEGRKEGRGNRVKVS